MLNIFAVVLGMLSIFFGGTAVALEYGDDSIGNKVRDWAPIVKGAQWQVYFAGGGGLSLVSVRIVGSEVRFEMERVCPGMERKVEKATLTWVAGDTVGISTGCDGKASPSRMPVEMEKRLKPFPKEIANLIGKKEVVQEKQKNESRTPPQSKPEIKVPPRPSIEDMIRVQPIHEARRNTRRVFSLPHNIKRKRLSPK